MKEGKWKKCILFVILFLIPISITFPANWGDTDSSGGIDIVDTLLVAQHFVDLNPRNFDRLMADVDGNDTINIVDALLISQYYVGLIDTFPALTITPAPTPVPSANLTPNPTLAPTKTQKQGEEETLDDLPPEYHDALDWIWTNRIVNERSTVRQNLIFDQIYAGYGELHYCIRWQSSLTVTLKQRQEIASMIARQVKNWTQHLANYDGWPYNDVKVVVVSWACVNASLLQNRQSDEIVYTDWTNDPLNAQNSGIPIQLPTGPGTCSRFDHFSDPNYTCSLCPGGLQNRFDMYLWGTTNFTGGAGGDWGQRTRDSYILNSSHLSEVTIIEHEIGHGFGLIDFYLENERPPGGFPEPTIMCAGNSATITNFDKWMLRYVWSRLKNDTNRFPPQ